MEAKETAAKFWVGLLFALLTTASMLGLPGWWGKGVAIALALVGSGMVWLTDNKPIPSTVDGAKNG
jgi:hypothetical protein